MRKMLITLAAIAMLVFLIPLDAGARSGGGSSGGWRGGGGGGGGMRGLSAGRGFHGGGFGRGGIRGFRASGFRHFSAGRYRGVSFRHAHFRGLRYRGGHFRRAQLRGLHWRGTGFANRGRFIATPYLYAPYAHDFSGFGYDYAYGYDDGCYELQPLLTSRRLIWRRVWVCY